MVRKGARKFTRRDSEGQPRRPYPFILKKRKCRFCADKNLNIDYFDGQFLRKFTTERGKIIPSRISGNCARHQRKLAKAIKRARNAGLLPFLAE
ncbi:MAG: 30S ribosomal protein S18 [Omnitrophica bacterium RBG_13_46_9]|nr:MAG: 30S ribosomal protein S18 [Omnitrophica bacterium RBG_13_46_9]